MSAYLLAYHQAGRTWLDSDGLHLAQSSDGLNWEPLHGPASCADTSAAARGFGVSLFLAPRVGRDRFLANARAFSPASERGRRSWAPFKSLLANASHCTDGVVLRDPFIFYHPPSRRYHLLWTTGWASPVIGHASSADLVDWSAQRELDVTRGLESPINAWAPEAFYDRRSKRTLVFWSTARGEPWTRPLDIRRSAHCLYYALARGGGASTTTSGHGMTTDGAEDPFHAALTAPRPLLPCHPHGPSVIDATMAPPSDGLYYLVYKLEVNKTLAIASSRQLEGPYTTIATDIAPGHSAEGPSVVRRARDELIVYFDRYEAGSYGAVRAPSMSGPWTDVSSELTMPAGVRHATAFRAPKPSVHRLRASYGTRERGVWRPDGVVLKPGQQPLTGVPPG